MAGGLLTLLSSLMSIVYIALGSVKVKGMGADWVIFGFRPYQIEIFGRGLALTRAFLWVSLIKFFTHDREKIVLSGVGQVKFCGECCKKTTQNITKSYKILQKTDEKLRFLHSFS